MRRRAWVAKNGEPEKKDEAEPGDMTRPEHKATVSPGEVWAVDTAGDRGAAGVLVGKHPAHMVLMPDGRFAYVTNGGENTVSVVDTEARRVVATIPAGKGPNGISVTA